MQLKWIVSNKIFIYFLRKPREILPRKLTCCKGRGRRRLRELGTRPSPTGSATDMLLENSCWNLSRLDNCSNWHVQDSSRSSDRQSEILCSHRLVTPLKRSWMWWLAQKRRRKNPRKNYSKLLIKKLRKSEGVDQTELLKYSYFQRNTSNVQFLTDSGRIAMMCSVCWVVNHVLYFFLHRCK